MSLICVVSVYPVGFLLLLPASLIHFHHAHAHAPYIYGQQVLVARMNEAFRPPESRTLHRKITRSFVGGTEHCIEREKKGGSRDIETPTTIMSLALGAFARLPKSQNISIGGAHCTLHKHTERWKTPAKWKSGKVASSRPHSVRCCCAQKRYRAPASSSSGYPFFVGNPHRNRACRAQPNNNNNPQNRETNIQHHTHTSQWLAKQTNSVHTGTISPLPIIVQTNARTAATMRAWLVAGWIW